MIESRPRKDRNGRKWTSHRAGVMVDGNKRWITLPKGRTRADAVIVEAQMKLALLNGTIAELLGDNDIEIAEYFENVFWPEYVLGAGTEDPLAVSTQKTYRIIWDLHLCPRVGAYSVQEFSVPHASALRRELLEDGVGAPTVRKGMSILQAVFNYAIEDGTAKANPMFGAKKPPQKRTRPVIAISSKQVADMVAAAEARGWHTDAMLIDLTADIARRPGEILAVPWLHLQGPVLRVYESVADGIIKDTKNLKTSITRPSKRIRQKLKRYRAAQGDPDDSALMFCRADGKPMRDYDYSNWRRRHFKKIVKDAGLEGIITRPYDLRHHGISRYIAEGRDPREVANLVGSSVDTIWRNYVHEFEVHGFTREATA